MSADARQRCVIVGASHAGAQVATRLRRLGWQGPIALVGEETQLPYHRPPLSKDYLKGTKSGDSMLLHAAAAYDNAGVELLLGRRVAALDRDQHKVTLADGDELAYDRLVLAVGSRPRRLPLPGADLDGVHYLRTRDDVDRIRAAVTPGRPAVIVGGGYIGLEVAASLHALGMRVTVVEALERVLQRITSEPVSRFFARVHREEGVEILTGVQALALHGAGSVRGVELANGESIEADLVVVGVGIVPNKELAADAGLPVSNGIDVDEQARTADPDIYAVGDCACFEHPLYPGRIRLESVQNANDQAVVAAKSLCGQPEAYAALPWFWSDQYDVKLQIAGLAAAADAIILRGSEDTGRKLSILYLRDGRLVAVDAINRPRDFVFGKKLIQAGARLDVDKAADENVLLGDALLPD